MALSWWGQQLLGVGVVLVWLALVAGLALVVRSRWPEWGEGSRKVVHIGSGPVVLLAWWLAIDRGIALAAASLISLLAAWNHRRRILPGLEDVDRHSYGTVAYGASITLLLLLWWPRQPLPVAAGVLVMAFGDGLAGLLGRQLHSFSWTLLGQRRSLVGTASMAVVSLLVLLGLAQAAAAFAQPAPPIPALAVIGLIATLLEQLAIGGLDNLTVPLAVGWLWSLWSLA